MKQSPVTAYIFIFISCLFHTTWSYLSPALPGRLPPKNLKSPPSNQSTTRWAKFSCKCILCEKTSCTDCTQNLPLSQIGKARFSHIAALKG